MAAKVAKRAIAPWPITLQPLNNGRDWMLVKPYARGAWTVPAGFVTDLASVPAAARGLVATWGKHGPAAILHDWMYRTQLDGLTRRMADRIMLEVMRQDGVGWLKRRAIYAAVRLGGGKHWI